MSYERNLTFNLRIRGLSEDEIAETLDEVRAHEAAAGTPAEAEFGKAEEYAKQFPKTRMRTRGTVITMIGVALSIAYVLVAVLLLFLYRGRRPRVRGPDDAPSGPPPCPVQRPRRIPDRLLSPGAPLACIPLRNGSPAPSGPAPSQRRRRPPPRGDGRRRSCLCLSCRSTRPAGPSG